MSDLTCYVIISIIIIIIINCKDPLLKQCENIEGFDVTDEVVPGPIYSAVSDLDEIFPLTYCYYVNKTEEEARLSCKFVA
jgi:hypothetical protein